MARKRTVKASSSKGKKPRPLNRSDSKLQKWTTIDDIPLDEEDTFHSNRDKILLDGDDVGDEDVEGDEVFALEGLSDGDSEEEDYDYGNEEGLEEDEDEELNDARKQLKKVSSKTRTKKDKKSVELPPPSDEDSEEEETWGKSRAAYYSSNAAELDSDDEEANELEEQEAIKIQAKARDALKADDFGLGDVSIDLAKSDHDVFTEPALPLVDLSSKDQKSLLKHLEKVSPETLALARDWDSTAYNIMAAKQIIEEMEREETDDSRLAEVHLHYQTLLTYASTLAFYLHLRAKPKYVQQPHLLKSHPVMARLLVLKDALTKLESFNFAAWCDDGDDEDLDGSEGEDSDMMLDAEDLWKLDQLKDLDADELQELIREASSATPKNSTSSKTTKVPAPPVEQVIPPLKKKRKTSSTEGKKSKPPTFDLVEPDFAATSSQAASRPSWDDTDAYGEASVLQHADAADKSARRKSLRFHTSKIESASARRQGARNAAAGGDDDIPYRERKKQREIREARENEGKRKNGTLGQGGEDLELDDPVQSDANKGTKRSRDDDDEDDDEDVSGYYELVKQAKNEKKTGKKAKYDAERESSRPDLDEENVSGPRSLTRAILKNKGLTPHRPKSVRNPRVKKRQKFEKAKRKVSSQKAVYKGGIGDIGKYQGERTGISKVAKGTRLV